MMDWNKQNASGIAWNNISETARKMYSTFWMANETDRKVIEKVIVEVIDKMQKMSCAIGD